jgi:hypothetical protein
MPIFQTNVWICEARGCGFMESTTAYTESYDDPVVSPPSAGWRVVGNDLLCPECAKAAEVQKTRIQLDTGGVKAHGA